MAAQKKDKDKRTKGKQVVEIELTNPEFQSTLSLLEQTNRSIFLTGKAGTGKSTFLRYITSTTKKKFVVLAPTGIAAVNVGGQTMHSFFKIPLKPLLPDDPDFAVRRLRQRLKYSKQLIKLIRELDLIIIDEISMVRADVIDFIDRVLRVYSGNMKLPFGGKQMLFVGDVFQLEPVVTGNDRDILSHAYSSFYFFSANVFREMNIVPIELTKVYRQEEQTFVTLLDHIRMGMPSQADLDILNARHNPSAIDLSTSNSAEFTMTIATRRDMVDSINEHHLAALRTPVVSYEGKIEKDFPTNALPTDLNLELKVGAQVVFVKNDPERRWVNGTVAVVEKCLPDSITVRTEDGEEHEVERERWSNVKYVYNEKTHQVDEIELGAFEQYPLKLAWALTIHKSQGLTFNKVIIDIGRGAFAGGQTYVALSRCRSLEGITLVNPISHRDIYVKPDISRFAKQFNDPQLIESAIEVSRSDALFRSAASAFDNGRFADAVSAYNQAIAIQPDIAARPVVQRLLSIKSLKLKALTDKLLEYEKRLSENRRRFEAIAADYVKTADTLGGEGWEADAAIAQYDKALSMAPGYGPALLGKARMLVSTGRLDDAYSVYELLSWASAELGWQGQLGMGDINASTGDDFGAISRYLSAYEDKPDQPEPIKRLAEAYERIGDEETAKAYRRKLATLKPKPNRT